jgi:hypothetical protein
MFSKDILKNIAVITTIVSLFFTFSFLVGFSNSRTEIPKRLSDGNTPFNDGEENGNGEENGSPRGINIDDLISLVQEATSKHLAVLQEVLANAPEPAKEGIGRAIEVSMRGSIRAIEALTRIKNSNKDNEDKGQKIFHIISSCNRGGTIVPKGIQFSEGESVGFSITSEEGYELVWVRVDNKKLEAVSSYSFNDINRNHTIHAHFKKIKKSSN